MNEKGALIVKENEHKLKESGHRSDFKWALLLMVHLSFGKGALIRQEKGHM